MMKFNIQISFSKIMALLILILSFLLDLLLKTNLAFMFSLPFITTLIFGKQYFDKNKMNKNE